MSHNICHRIYPEKVNKKNVQEEWDEYVRMEDWQEGASGLVNPIRWIDKIYATEEEAHKAIEEMDRGWYDQLAVKFYNPITFSNKKTEELHTVTSDAYKEYTKRNTELYANTITSALITCKGCNSKLAREYLKSNHCPVCRAELRPEHMLKRIAAAERKYQTALKNEKEYTLKHAKKEICWLVKIEYHT